MRIWLKSPSRRASSGTVACEGLPSCSRVIGTTALQQSAQFTRIVPTMIMAVCYGLAFYALSVVVQHMPMGVVYAIWSGIGIALISLIGAVFLGQHLDRAAVAGIALIASHQPLDVPGMTSVAIEDFAPADLAEEAA